MQIYKIDKAGYMVLGSDAIIFPDDSVPEGYINVPLPKDTAGNQLPFYKPRWTGTEWIEGMLQSEIDDLNNQPKDLSEYEMIMLAVAELAELVLGGTE